MKKLTALALAVCLVLSLAACGMIGKQTASSTIKSGTKQIPVKVDLAGNWSVQFADDAVYLYNGEDDGEKEPVGVGRICTKQDYDDAVEAHSGDEDFEESENGVKFTEGEEGNRKYIFAADDVYFMVEADGSASTEAIFNRFTVGTAVTSGESEASEGSEGSEGSEQTADGVNYLVLVNKLNELPEGWEDEIETVKTTNSVGDEVEVEKKTYEAYEALKADLEENDGIELELDSGRRTVAEQQEIMDDFIERYGEEYAVKTVATPGFSEHHTGLAVDLYFRIDGEDVYYNEDLVTYPEIWEKVHAKLADYGFILRYLEGKEHITGYSYEPWHIRYIDDTAVAKEIMDSGVTLEEYVGAVKTYDVAVDYGDSDIYDEDEIEEAMVVVKCAFQQYEGCTLNSISYGGDDADSDENLAWLESIGGQHYINAMKIVTDFHTSDESSDVLEANTDYNDYEWWLAHTENDGWEIVTRGY